MIYGFYFRFYKILNNEIVSTILARMAYIVYLAKFQMKRVRMKKNFVRMDSATALAKIESLYAKPDVSIAYHNPPIDPQLDLSIIVPIYNYADLIGENIESILKQKTHYRFELILVDDGSVDGARDIALSYRNDPRVQVVLQENGGIASARNNGINHATGKYIMFVDCDDTIHDDMIETLLNKAYENSYDIVMCAHNLSKERNGAVYQVIPNVYPHGNLCGYKNGDEIMNYAGLPWCKVYKREMWNQVRFFPGYWYEDTIIQFLLFSQCKKFAYVPKICYEYRWYEKNFSHVQGGSVNPKVIDRYWLLLDLIEHYKEIGLPLDAKFYTLLLRHVSSYYYNTIARLDEEAIEALFTVVCDLVEQYRPVKGCKLPYILRVTERAMLDRDINLWKLTCKYQ